MDWRDHASKMIVLIADAPPHGIGEYGDGEYFYRLFALKMMNVHAVIRL